ncbi:hypothetical protein [Halalkalibacter hemicellulosilyticus]|uniref:Integral membrane protein n=1 Tax=Halalkalibacter hemicellulosilyticusJCM 9152 TaxID=1236971 RepID=W4QDM2_9BACI|nr:hypothetical protein [Halalkalibacter hemicellulosilyticus]GAE29788.1 integral membrane protein [Halalkalibacter hemicellulosilyticusJCM 9152]
MTYFYQNGWILFLLSEGITWLCIFVFLVFRYIYQLNRLSHLFLHTILLCTFFQAMLAGINYYYTGKVSFFQVLIILFILYGSTLGTSHFKNLDKFIQQRLSKNRHIRTSSDNDHRIDTDNYPTLFFMHTLFFIAIHWFWFSYDFYGHDQLANISFQQIPMWIESPHNGFFSNPLFNIISYIWYIIYLFDLTIFVLNTILRSIMIVSKKKINP